MRISRTLYLAPFITLAVFLFSCSRPIPHVLLHGDITNDQASVMAAYTIGRPDLAHELVRIARREGNGKKRGIHARDAWASSVAWRRAVKKGYLDPTCQPNGPGWSTRGSHGLIAAYHVHLVPEVGPCAGPEVLDNPGVSALAAARKARKFATCPQRIRAWVGRGGWSRLSLWRKWRKTVRQCGASWTTLVDLLILR